MQFPEGTTDIYVFHRVQTGSGEKPASYAIGAGPFLGNIAAGVVKLNIHISPVTSSGIIEFYLRYAHMFSCRDN
jgi:hypothetical protein